MLLIITYYFAIFCRYDVEFKQEPFYTGGRVQVTADGGHLLATCRNAVKVIDMATGLVVNSIEEVNNGYFLLFFIINFGQR